MNVLVYVIIVLTLLISIGASVYHQRKLRLRAHLMEEAIRNRDFTFRLPTDGLLSGERAMQETLNKLGGIIREQVNRNEVESWERLTRVLTHEMMNATAPITSISQSLLGRSDVKGTPLEDGIQAIHDTSRHLSDFVANYRKMSDLEKPILTEVDLHPMFEEIKKLYSELSWKTKIAPETLVHADAGMLRQVLINMVKNAVEAKAQRIVVEPVMDKAAGLSDSKQLVLYVGNDGLPIPAANRQSLFVPFFTTKRGGSGIGLSLSRRMMIQQGGMLELAEKQMEGCAVGFLLTIVSLS